VTIESPQLGAESSDGSNRGEVISQEEAVAVDSAVRN
jgi:hypothetical protein